MSTIKDVALRAGVSISTVSNVLNKKKYVSPELIRKVEAAVKELSYSANPIARSMKSNKSHTIGIITQDLCGVFYPYVIKGISSIIEEAGFQMIIVDARGVYGELTAIDRERVLLNNLLQSRVDGIIFVSSVSSEGREKYIQQLNKQMIRHKSVALVSLERDFTSFGIDSVYFDGYENARIAVKHLIDCGCKTIGHISGPQSMEIVTERIKGYVDIINEMHFVLDEKKMIVEGDYSHQSGYRKMKELLDNMPSIDGVFCGNDQMAVGALKLLQNYNKRVPEDIKLIGYDDAFVSSIVEPAISTIHIRKFHAGAEAAKLLLKRIENPQRDVVGKLMESRLVVRKSTIGEAPEDWILADW